MALNFPDSPTLNQVYTDTTSGFSYQWDGTVWQSYSPAASKNISIVDDISGSFNGSTTSFNLLVSGTALTPANAQQLRVVLGGIVQEPLVDYTVSSSVITFTTAPSALLDCSIVSLGPAVAVSVPVDGTVTPVKLSTGGPSWNTSGNLTVSGSATISGNVSIGGTLTYEDVTNVDSVGLITARSGVRVTAGTVVVGSGVTVSSGGINVVGVVTATTFTGSLSGNATGLSGTPNLNVGIVTVTGLGGVAYAGITSTAVNKTLINREYCTVVAAGVTITLPASPSPGWEVGIAVGNFTSTVVARNGSNIMALAENFNMDIAYLALQFVYVDSVQGWRYF
jgi:hypothetical protein